MKKILLAVCGKTPQIITETLYALWEKGDMPDVIRLITTKAGKESIFSSLLDPKHGVFYQFCKEYEIDHSKIQFDWTDIIVPRGIGELELEDITSEEDSSLFLRHCLEEVFHLSSNPDNVLFFSIAGGRKTMGASLTIAAQYYGRAQDSLFHVLVSAEFENNPHFYYIPREEKVISLRNSLGEESFKSTKYAKISLVSLPFFSIRERLSNQMLAKPVSPQELVLLMQKSQKPTLRIQLSTFTLEWQGKQVKMPLTQFTIYLFFLLQKKALLQGLSPETAVNTFSENTPIEQQACFEMGEILDRKDEIAKLYGRLQVFLRKNSKGTSDSGIVSLTHENCRSYISRVKDKITKNFGTTGYSQIGILSYGKSPDTRYGIPIAPHLIEIIDEVGIL